MNNKLKNIIWDWNGTLIDDLDVCIEGVNILLERRKLPLMNEARYKEIFTFPIRKYYEAAGFDFSKEPFEVPAEEFIQEYKLLIHKARLFPDVHVALSAFAEAGIRQFILSAMEEKALHKTLHDHGIFSHFTGVFGISDNYAVSKINRGEDMLLKHSLSAEDTVIIGDTLHDAEVATALGIPVLLIGRGHQHRQRLSQVSRHILADMQELVAFLKNGGPFN